MVAAATLNDRGYLQRETKTQSDGLCSTATVWPPAPWENGENRVGIVLGWEQGLGACGEFCMGIGAQGALVSSQLTCCARLASHRSARDGSQLTHSTHISGAWGRGGQM
jgi:hypothetical protein